MTQRFLITGMPRSRTAWLAAVCNAMPTAICYHEPLHYVEAWQEALDVWRDDLHDYVGLSDHALGFHLGAILDGVAPRTLIVERERGEVLKSLATLNIGTPAYAERFLDILEERLKAFHGHPLVRRVAFSSLQNEEILLACIDHLMPGVSIDLAKIRALSAFNIQADMAGVSASLPQAPGDTARLLGIDVMKALAS